MKNRIDILPGFDIFLNHIHKYDNKYKTDIFNTYKGLFEVLYDNFDLKIFNVLKKEIIDKYFYKISLQEFLDDSFSVLSKDKGNLFFSTSTGTTSHNSELRPMVICNDGFSISIQGQDGSYSIPRKFTNKYDSMELGYPNMVDEIIREFAEDVNDPMGSIYGYVDFDIIDKMINNHHGISILTGLNWSKIILRKLKIKKLYK